MKIKSIAFWLATFVILLVFVLPLLWMYITSIKANADIYSTDISKILIFSPTLDNYYYLFFKTGFLKELRNTLIVAVSSTALVMAVSLPAAYSFSRFNTGYGHLLFITISTRMFPGAVAAIPFFFAFKTLGLLDTTFGLTMLYLYFNMSFAIFLLYGFFREIPVELEHAAMIDGHSQFAIFRKVVFPVIKPGAAITAIFCLVFSWNEFLFAFLFTRTAARTVNIGLVNFLDCDGDELGRHVRLHGDGDHAHAGCRLVYATIHYPGADLWCCKGIGLFLHFRPPRNLEDYAFINRPIRRAGAKESIIVTSKGGVRMGDEKASEAMEGIELFHVKDFPKNPKAMILIVHGLAEHCGRYDYVVEKLNECGYGVYRFDNRGHGRSGGKRGYLDDFHKFIDDADFFVEKAKNENPGLPLFMLGHSMGGFIAAGYGAKYPGKLKGQIFSGPVIVELPIFDALKGMDVENSPETPIPNSLSQLICRDQKVVKDYENDPLVLKETTLKLLTTVFLDGVEWLKSHLKTYHYPCLILHGGDDQIVDKMSSEYLYGNIASDDKSIKIYDGFYHEILNEKERDTVISDIHRWIEKRL